MKYIISSAKCGPGTSSVNPFSSEQGPLSSEENLMLTLNSVPFFCPQHFDVVLRPRGLHNYNVGYVRAGVKTSVKNS
jgi:hypothetical protein